MVSNLKLEERAFNWCSKFLGGTWAKSTLELFKMTPIRGALTNYIYTCELDQSVAIEDHESRKVLLRIYGEISGPHEKFCEILIFNMLSERKIGPRLLGAFKDGRIEQYIESVPLTVFQLRDGSHSVQIARKMAKYHLLDIPLQKKPTFVSRFVSRYIQYLNKAIAAKDDMKPRCKEIMEEIIQMDIIMEFETLKKALEGTNPVSVFCHNDIQEGNLLALPTHKDDHEQHEIVLIDYEYSYYGYRGFDIGNHFCEWMINNVASPPLGFEVNPQSYPDYNHQIIFAKSYIDCISEELINAKESKRRYFLTTPEELVKESNQHSLMSNLLWGFWGIAQHYLSHIEFDFLEYALARFRLYFLFKERFFPCS